MGFAKTVESAVGAAIDVEPGWLKGKSMTFETEIADVTDDWMSLLEASTNWRPSNTA
ncbi:hypothetical protein HDU82_000668, partial [Entophlyctis luteolus]